MCHLVQRMFSVFDYSVSTVVYFATVALICNFVKGSISSLSLPCIASSAIVCIVFSWSILGKSKRIRCSCANYGVLPALVNACSVLILACCRIFGWQALMLIVFSHSWVLFRISRENVVSSCAILITTSYLIWLCRVCILWPTCRKKCIQSWRFGRKFHTRGHHTQHLVTCSMCEAMLNKGACQQRCHGVVYASSEHLLLLCCPWLLFLRISLHRFILSDACAHFDWAHMQCSFCLFIRWDFLHCIHWQTCGSPMMS